MQRPPADGRHGAPEPATPAAPAASASAPAEQRQAAHAAPYMDADGTLHNLRPIARLEVSGPDPEPKRTADTEFGGKWFSPPKEGAPEQAADGAGDRRDAAEQTTAAEETTAAQHEVEAQHTTAAQRATAAQATSAAQETPAAQKTTAAQQTTAAQYPSAARQTTTADEAPSAEGTSSTEGGMVLNLDLAGLFNGVAIETEPETGDDVANGTTGVRRGESAPDGTDRAARVTPGDPGGKGHGAGGGPGRTGGSDVASLIPGPEPAFDKDAARPKKPPAALAAADLDAIRWRLDGGTLREVVDNKDALRELGERLDEPLADETDNVAKAGLLSVRAEVYRLLGELGMAASAVRLALAHAESAQDTQSTVIAQAELAHILRLRKNYEEADKLFGKAAAADVPDSLRSVVHENAGRCCFDQGRHMEALDHFARAVRLGREDDQELAERIGVCLEAVYIHVLRDGWGPYPRKEPVRG